MPDGPRYYALAERPLIDGVYGLPTGSIGAVDLAPVGGHSYVFCTSARPFNVEDVAINIGDGTPLDEYSPSPLERSALATLMGVSYGVGFTLLDWLWDILTVNADPDGQNRAKPLMPTCSRMLELHLGGHSRIRKQYMPQVLTDHPAWSNIQRVLQNDYRAIRAEAMRGFKGKGQPDLHLKYLEAMRIKYRLKPESARDLIGDTRDGLPVRPTTTLSDNFDRADAGTLGGSWTEFGTNWAISSNNATVTAGGGNSARYDSDLSSTDMTVSSSAVSVVSGGSNACGVACRFSSSSETLYACRANTRGTDALQIDKVLAGSLTNLLITATVATLDTGPWAVTGSVDGSTVSVDVDGETDSVTDTAITAPVRGGLAFRQQFYDGIWADWAAEDLISGPAFDARKATRCVGRGIARGVA